VAYHLGTVLGRGDDDLGIGLAYYASRGETQLRWGGSGAAVLGLEGAVTLSRERFQALPSDQQARVAALLHAETAMAGEPIAGICLPDRAATLGQAEAALALCKKRN
jgi:hypothetical protein